jgi:hypothetical protein
MRAFDVEFEELSEEHKQLYDVAEEDIRMALVSLMASPNFDYEKNRGLLLYTILDMVNRNNIDALELDIISACDLVERDSGLNFALHNAISTMDFRALLRHRMSSAFCVLHEYYLTAHRLAELTPTPQAPGPLELGLTP